MAEKDYQYILVERDERVGEGLLLALGIEAAVVDRGGPGQAKLAVCELS